MKLTTHSQLHNKWMESPEYRAAYEEATLNEQLTNILDEWRNSQKLSSADVAIRLGVSHKHLSMVERNPSQATLAWFYRYAKACNVDNPKIQFDMEID